MGDIDTIFENSWRSMFNAYLIPEAFPVFADLSKFDEEEEEKAEEQYLEFDSPVCALKLKSDLETFDETREKALNNLFEKFDSFDTSIEIPAPQYFPVALTPLDIMSAEGKKFEESKLRSEEIKARSVAARSSAMKTLSLIHI